MLSVRLGGRITNIGGCIQTSQAGLRAVERLSMTTAESTQGGSINGN